MADFTLIPASDALTVDQRLEAALSGVVPSDDEDEVRPFGRGWAFDFATGQFVQHGSSPARVDGLSQLVMWIEKVLLTARFAHDIYSEVFGVDAPWDAFGKPVTSATQADIAEKVVEALTEHDRIASVTNFSFSKDPLSPALFVSFNVSVSAGAGFEPDIIELSGLAFGGGG